jgi:predicted lipid-binding transport protein (Tim44 family)
MQGLEQAEKTLHEQIEARRKALLAALEREPAEQALAALHARESEFAAASNAVTAMLQRYVDAWNANDVERITALHRSPTAS